MDLTTLSKKKKSIVVIAFIALGLFAIAGIVGVFVLNYNTFLPPAPSILDDGQSTIITTEYNENYVAYRFRFRSTLKDDVVIDSKLNTLTDKEISASDLQLGAEYKVSVCYLGETEGDGTEYSESTTWKYTKTLQAPIIVLDEDATTIKWDSVEKAESYYVYYKNGVNYQRKEITETTFNYSTLACGENEIFVIAKASAVGYNDSKPSNKVNFVYKIKMKELDSATYNASTNEIVVVANETIDYLTITIDSQNYVAKLATPEVSNGKYTYKVLITSIYKEGYAIKVAPCPSNTDYVFTGNAIEIVP